VDHPLQQPGINQAFIPLLNTTGRDPSTIHVPPLLLDDLL